MANAFFDSDDLVAPILLWCARGAVNRLASWWRSRGEDDDEADG